MSALTYILDSALVLVVLLQLKEKVLTNMTLLRPFIILGVAVASYFTAFPTAGNDVLVILATSAIGAVIGVLSGITVHMRRNDEGNVTARAGAASAIFWVLGMGSRFAFAVWAASHAGAIHLTHFSISIHVTTGQTWTVALLGMAVCEVLGRTFVMIYRRHTLATGTSLVGLA